MEHVQEVARMSGLEQGDTDSHRQRRRVLDACLDALETAHERDEVVVSAKLGLRLQQHLSSIAPGILIADAIEMVFQEQESLESSYLVVAQPPGADDDLLGTGLGGPGLVSRNLNVNGSIGVVEARKLTEQIRTATRTVCLLLLDAYERRVWFALGYRNWEEYVRCALGFRRSRSYELLDQARTIRALQEAASTSAVPDVSAFTAELIKPHLGEVLETVRARADGVASEHATEIIAEVVEQRLRIIKPRRAFERLAKQAGSQVRSSSPEDAQGLPHLLPSHGPADVRQLLDAIDYLADLPAIDGQPVTVDQALIDPAELDRAVRWLVEFEAACGTRSGNGGPAIALYAPEPEPVSSR
jgi:hypothetical protein